MSITNQGASEHKENSNLLECDVCFKNYDGSEEMRPRLLLCGHTFCSNCLSLLINEKEKDVRCPTCRQTTPASNGVQDLQSNFALIELLETFSKMKTGNTCEECELRYASFWCDSCESNLCSECCTTLHKLKSLRKHKPVRLENKSKIECEKHETEKLSIFCVNCQVPICYICRDPQLGAHAAHDVKLIKDAEEETKQKLATSQAQCSDVGAKLDEFSFKIAEVAAKHTKSRTEISAEIDYNFDTIIKAVEKRRNMFHSQCNTEFAARLNSLQQQRLELASTIAMLQTLDENVKQTSSVSGISSVVTHTKLISSYSDILNKCKKFLSQPVEEPRSSVTFDQGGILSHIAKFGSAVFGSLPPVVKDLAVSNIISNSVKLSWNPAKHEEAVTYVVQQRCHPEEKEWQLAIKTGSRDPKLMNLRRNQTYKFRVACLTVSFPNPVNWSSEVTCRTNNNCGISSLSTPRTRSCLSNKSNLATFCSLIPSRYTTSSTPTISAIWLQNVDVFVLVLDNDISSSETTALDKWVSAGGLLIVGIFWQRDKEQNSFLQHWNLSVGMDGGQTLACTGDGLFEGVDKIFMYGSAHINVEKSNATSIYSHNGKTYIANLKVGSGNVVLLPHGLFHDGYVKRVDNRKFMENFVAQHLG